MKKIILLAGIFLVIIVFKNVATPTVLETPTIINNSDVKVTSDCSTSGCHGCKRDVSLMEYQNKL
jgi:hypothetical protein